MDEDQLHLRNFLINIGDRLSKEDCQRLIFLLDQDVPRRILEETNGNSAAAWNKVWDELIIRGKIRPDDINYLIPRFENIRRLDLVGLLKKYSPPSNTSPSSGQATKSSDLFVQYNP